MSSLTDAAEQTKNIVTIVVLFLIVLIFLRIAADTWRRIRDRNSPIPPPAPTVSLGKLLSPNMPGMQSIDNQRPKLVLDLIDTSLPQSPDIMHVLINPHGSLTLFSIDRATDLAKQFGFLGDPEKLTSTRYRWKDSKLPREIEIDIVDLNFTITYHYLEDQKTIQQGRFTDKDSVIKIAEGILRSRRLLPQDIEAGNRYVHWLIINSSGQIEEVDNPQIAIFAKVDLMRTNLTIDDTQYPLYHDEARKGNISLILGGFSKNDLAPGEDQASAELRSLISLNYTYWPYTPQDPPTYPIIKSSDAWNAFLNFQYKTSLFSIHDNAVKINDAKVQEIRIQYVSLGYFDGLSKHDTTQPIYVFEGIATLDNNIKADFIGYLPAITSDWLKVIETSNPVQENQ